MKKLLRISARLVVIVGTLLNSLLASHMAQAQLPAAANPQSASPGRTIIRLDFLAPLGANIAHNFWTDKGLLMPISASYERAIANRWSVGAEVLLNGGYPDEQRKGAGLLVRYYVRPDKKTLNPLAGWYVAPMVNYLALKVTDEPPLLVIRAHRLRTGVLLGWQHRLIKSAPRVVLDVAVGAVYWSALGNDQVYEPGNKSGAGFGILEPGFLPDARGGIGYQF